MFDRSVVVRKGKWVGEGWWGYVPLCVFYGSASLVTRGDFIIPKLIMNQMKPYFSHSR